MHKAIIQCRSEMYVNTLDQFYINFWTLTNLAEKHNFQGGLIILHTVWIDLNDNWGHKFPFFGSFDVCLGSLSCWNAQLIQPKLSPSNQRIYCLGRTQDPQKLN